RVPVWRLQWRRSGAGRSPARTDRGASSSVPRQAEKVPWVSPFGPEGAAEMVTTYHDSRKLFRTRSLACRLDNFVPSLAARQGALTHVAGDDPLTLALAAQAQFLIEEERSHVRRDHLQAALTEVLFQLGNHADAGPRPPGDGHDPAGPTTVQLHGQLAQ